MATLLPYSQVIYSRYIHAQTGCSPVSQLVGRIQLNFRLCGRTFFVVVIVITLTSTNNCPQNSPRPHRFSAQKISQGHRYHRIDISIRANFRRRLLMQQPDISSETDDRARDNQVNQCEPRVPRYRLHPEASKLTRERRQHE